MTKFVFCFDLPDGHHLIFSIVWQQYLSNVPSEQVSVYTCGNAAQYFPCQRHFDNIHSMNDLLKRAIEDVENECFLVLPHDSLPLAPFDAICKGCMTRSQLESGTEWPALPDFTTHEQFVTLMTSSFCTVARTADPNWFLSMSDTDKRAYWDELGVEKPVPHLVSVIIPTYNRYDVLLVAVHSVLEQTYREVELVIVNDCSTDPRYYQGALEALPRTRVVHLPRNMRKAFGSTCAQGKTRELGAWMSRGEWIAYLDDDDYWFPQKLEVQLQHTLDHAVKFSTTNIWFGHGMYRSGHERTGRIIYHCYRKPEILSHDLIERDNRISCSAVLLHRSVMEHVGSFVLGKHEDHQYWKRVLATFPCLMCPEPLIYNDRDSGGARHYF